MCFKTYTKLLIFILIGHSLRSYGQSKISLEDIWKTYKFSEAEIPKFKFLPNSKKYTMLKDGSIYAYDIVTGNKTESILEKAEIGSRLKYYDDYLLSHDDNKIILASDIESIHRNSFKANYYVWDRTLKSLVELATGPKQIHPDFSPTNDKIAYVAENNLYYKDLKTNKIIAVTTDGKKNFVINGIPDWVYEEEFLLEKAFQWSPDGKYLAYIKFDESKVPESTIDYWYDLEDPVKYTYKYPKAGMNNSIVNVFIYNVESKKTKKVQLSNNDEDYIPRIKWTQNPKQLCITILNRHQNELQLKLVNPENDEVKPLMNETNEKYLEITDNLFFLKNTNGYIWTSEKDGFNHIYLYGLNGNLIKQLTSGSWDVTDVLGIDENHGYIYFQAAIKSPIDRQVYKIAISGGELISVSKAPGYNSMEFSSDFNYYILNYSNINRPPMYTVYDIGGKRIRDIESNNELVSLQIEYAAAPVEFFQFTSTENIKLNGWMIKPVKLEPIKKYPVLMYQYSGPNEQEVLDEWKGQNYWWFQMLVQQGYIIVCVDGRGTGARGEAFRKITYKKMGYYETKDQIETAKYIKNLAYVDPKRIGIYGWSYGGYISSLCILKAEEVFKAAIAVAPVANWKWYNSIYSERYMGTVNENQNTYLESSPISYADRLKGNYLIIQGCADDNVGLQNSFEMVKALVEANKQFESFFYPNKDHNIIGGLSHLHLYTKMTDFIYKNL